VYIHIDTYIHTHNTYIHTCIYTNTYTHTCIYIHIHTYIHACMHAYMHTYIHTYIHTYVYIYTYMHIHIHTQNIHNCIRTNTQIQTPNAPIFLTVRPQTKNWKQNYSTQNVTFLATAGRWLQTGLNNFAPSFRGQNMIAVWSEAKSGRVKVRCYTSR
jgi:hypothetical protein